MAGSVAGLLQWFVLRPQFHKAGWWIVVSTIGWAVGMAIGFAVGTAFGWPLIGAVGGALTGFPLIWLIRQPIVENRRDIS